MGGCPSESELHAYHAEELNKADQARIRKHLAGCKTCARRNAELVARHEKILGHVKDLSLRDTEPIPSGPAAGPPAMERNSPENHVPESPHVKVEGYEIVRELHRGGQGIVYQAVQTPTKRKVAIKVLLEGPYASDNARRRFEREIELVASLRHPNIISVFHSGQTQDGRQFCVMDYVRGVPLSKYVQQKKLSLEEALRLFAAVCEAVNYAHQKGVIHRDLKPSNILVDSDGVPKVLDFGLAKSVGGPEQTLVSVTGQLVGTLPYMSPEQARGNPDEIDIRTDVYALGVILYELLTGHFPYPVVGQMAEVLRNITETKPTPLSRNWRRDSGVTQRSTRRIHPGECPIDDEVQTIVLKALSKERLRRYQSPGELARDVSHYLAGEPIEAKRDSRWYVLRKSMRRYKGPLAATLAFVALLVAAVIVSTSLYYRADAARVEAEQARVGEAEQRKLAEQREEDATEARKLATQRADQLETVTRFQESMLSEIDAERMGRGIFAKLREDIREALKDRNASPEEIDQVLGSFDVSLMGVNATNLALKVIDEQVLSRAVETIAQKFADQPLLEAALRQTIGDTYEKLGLYEQAMPNMQRALALRRNVLGSDHPDTLVSINNMGALLSDMGKLEEAMLYYREALERRHRVLGDNQPDTLVSTHSMGYLLSKMGKFEEALPYYREALTGFRRVLGDNHLHTLTAITNMGHLLKSTGNLKKALPYYREALERKRRVLGDTHPETLKSINNIGVLLEAQGKLDEAEPYIREAMETSRRVLGDNHPDTLIAIGNLGFLLQSMGKLEEALPYYREALERERVVLGSDHPDTLVSINNMGTLLWSLGRYAEAEPYFRDAVETSRRELGDTHPETLKSINNMGALLEAQGKLEDAEPYYREALDVCRRVLGNSHPDTLVAINNMGVLLSKMEMFNEALPYQQEALDVCRRVLGDNHRDTLISINNMARLLQDLGQLEDAEVLADEAVRRAKTSLGSGDWLTGIFLRSHGICLSKLARFDEAESALLESHEILAAALTEEHPQRLQVIEELAGLYNAWGKPDKAAKWMMKLPDVSDKPVTSPTD